VVVAQQRAGRHRETVSRYLRLETSKPAIPPAGSNRCPNQTQPFRPSARLSQPIQNQPFCPSAPTEQRRGGSRRSSLVELGCPMFIKWRTYDSLVNALDAIDDENRSNPVAAREWQVCERSIEIPSARTWEHA
jgi:hypothetical protein